MEGVTKQRLKPVIRLLMLLLAGGTPLVAAKHPVPLEKDADCATCHQEKTKGKAVHSAIALGCTTCHEVRATKDVTRVKLITATPAALCLSCHADKNAADITGHVHPPAARDCLTCHDPHTSDNKNQLRKATTGGKDENLCLSCHRTGVNVPEKGSRHAALDMGCDTCHTTHKVGDPGKGEFKNHLTKSTPALCLDCHDGNDAALQKAHNNQPFATADCITCHDPHQSDRPKLMQAYLHPPFAERQCEVCHNAPKDGKVVLTQTESRQLCLTCHDDKGKLIETAKVQHPGAAGDCIDCHSPHASKQPGLPKTNAVSICLACHADQAEQHAKKNLHQPAFEQGCATCHEPHGGANEHLLRVANINALCLECHGPESNPGNDPSLHALTIFNGQVKLPGDYYRKNRVPILPIRYGRGHPVANHPVQDVLDPTDSSKIKTAINCLTCHQPHSSAQSGLLVKDQADNMAFCDTCHKNRMDFEKGTRIETTTGQKKP
jgi:predicted CXXCH cytochrome family protein